ncbi:hypothetical protein BY996DRAFT_4474526 [Phakopsora pachyrhizi]|nr:hypothetical protein BY996DRAFT_4474526 [Phakopsora pachyrhizi]
MNIRPWISYAPHLRPLHRPRSERSSSSQDSTLLPSPLPTWEDHSRGNGLIDFNQSTTDHQGLSRTDEDLSKDLFEDGLGGGRRALSVEILEEPLDLDRLLAPDSMDSNDRSSNSKTDNHQKMSLIEASNILGPSRCIGRSEVEDVGLRGRYPDVEDGWYDVNPPSSKKHEDLNEPNPKQLINQDEMGSENSKRKQLLEELGFEDDSIDNAINQRSSSPIQIINTMNKNNKHYSSNQNEQNEDFDDYDEDGDESIEISFIQDKQTELQQLSEIGIVVTESPTQVLKMAGVRDTPLSSNSRLSKAQEQTEEWDRLLTRQKSSRTSNGANSGDGRRKRKSWNSNNWRFKRGSKRGAAAGGSRSRGGARGRVSSKGVGRVTVVSGSNGRVKRNI